MSPGFLRLQNSHYIKVFEDGAPVNMTGSLLKSDQDGIHIFLLIQAHLQKESKRGPQ